MSSASDRTARVIRDAVYVPIVTIEDRDHADVADLRERVRRLKATGRTYMSGSHNIHGEFMTRQELLTEVYLYVTQTLGDLLYGDDDTWIGDVVQYDADVHVSLDGATKGEDVAVVFPRVREAARSIDKIRDVKDFVMPISTRI